MRTSRTGGWLALAVALIAGCAGASEGPSDSASDGPGATAAIDPTAATPVALHTSMESGDTAAAYDLGEFHGTDLWVDPVDGDDSNDGRDRDHAMQTIDAAWRTIPAGIELTTGYRMRLVAGTYPQATSVNYWEDRHGSADAPIIIEAADGAHTAVFEGDINMYGVSHFSLLGVDIVRQGDTFHCELCDHILIRDVELSGGADGEGAHETVKVNQSQYVYIENSDIHGADDNAIDFVAVQYGHVTGNRIHDALDWCTYAKGGSGYLTYSNNEVYDCGTGGITAGQGTGFEFMVAPWLNYEAYGIQIVGNVIHDTEGAGLGVAGGFNVVFAGNMLYDVGTRSHLVEFVHGRRGCDGMVALCNAHHDAGGWGSDASEEAMIPNRHISFVNNVIVNPTGVQSQWQQFQIDGPIKPPAGSGVSSPSLADDDLLIAGNVIWNGPADHPSGIDDDTRIRATNVINVFEPRLVDPHHGDFSLTDASKAQLPAPVPVPDFIWDATPIPVPAGAIEVG